MSHKRKEKIYFVEEPTSEDTVCLPVYIMTNKSSDEFSLDINTIAVIVSVYVCLTVYYIT